MADFTTQITAVFQAVQFRAPTTAQLALYNAELNNGLPLAGVTNSLESQVINDPYTITFVDPVIREYQAAYGRVPDQAGLSFWVNGLANGTQTLATLSTTFANAPEFAALYGTGINATTPASPALVQALYFNVLGRAPDAPGLAFWSSQNLNASQLLAAFAQSPEYIEDTTNVGGSPPIGIPSNNPVYSVVGTFELDEAGKALGLAGVTVPVPPTSLLTLPIAGAEPTGFDHLFTLGTTPGFTVGSDIIVGNTHDEFIAPLAGLLGTQPTLSSGDFLQSSGVGALASKLVAYFDGQDYVTSLNSTGIAIWDINLEAVGPSFIVTGIPGLGGPAPYTVYISADAPTGPDVISGLLTLAVNVQSGYASLSIGDNGEPVLETPGAFTVNGFNLSVFSALGLNIPGLVPNGVDIDFSAQTFVGNNIINVTADNVGGFPEFSVINGPYIIPPEILVESNNGDDYNPNWIGYLGDAYGIAAGASAGPNGPVGFQTWNVASVDAKNIGALNIIGLGGEGSSTATALNLTDDGSNTMLFATRWGGSLSTDWKNLATIDLSKTTGFVTLTGLETNVQEALPTVNGGPFGFLSKGLSSSTLATNFAFFGGGGLLASDTSALLSIVGGAGNSFYDASSLTLAAAQKASIDGGHSTAGNSEVAFNNAVFQTTTPININHIQVLDDVSSTSVLTVPDLLALGGTATLLASGEAQGGIINMANFATLQPLNVNYTLPAENLASNGGINALVPFGLPYTVPPSPGFTGVPSSAPGVVAPQPTAFDLQNGIAPAGYQLLQFLNADGSTQTVLGADLAIYDDFVQFAINMQDLADGYSNLQSGGGNAAGTFWNGFNVTIHGMYTVPVVNTADIVDIFVSDDGIPLHTTLFSSLTTTVSNTVFTATGTFSQVTSTAFYAPGYTIDNYTTVNIALPWESTNTTSGSAQETFTYIQNGITFTTKANVQNYTILGGSLLAGFGPSFNDTPVVSVSNATLNFYDNHADNGGSPPGGPTNLVLGDTNFTDQLVPIPTTLLPAGIGVTSVLVDGSTSVLGLAATTINFFNSGNVEIGATNATNINAQPTSHLVIDLPATLAYVNFSPTGGPAQGVTVFGSLLGQNLLQGTAGYVLLDGIGHDYATLVQANGGGVFGTEPTGYNPPLTSFNINTGGIGSALFEGGVLGFFPQLAGANGEWGNDTLTGGAGWGNVTTSASIGGFTYTVFTPGLTNANVDTFAVWTDNVKNNLGSLGNTGDNFFTEGGNDVVNINANEQGVLSTFASVVSSSGNVLLSAGQSYDNDSTVWVGFFDVCNSAGPNAGQNNLGAANYGIGAVYDQSITDLGQNTLSSPGYTQGGETFMNGYGVSPSVIPSLSPLVNGTVVTINGFHFTGPAGNLPSAGGGDTIVFGEASWAVGTFTTTSSTPDMNSPSSTGPLATPANTYVVQGLVQSDGNTPDVASPAHGNNASYVQAGTANTLLTLTADVILDSISPTYANAQDLANALSLKAVGNILLTANIGTNHTADILVAYNTATSINIADVTLTNLGAPTNDTSAMAIGVHDLIHISNPTGLLGLSNFTPHNILLLA